MEDKLYQICLRHSNNYNGIDGFWEKLAKENGYKNSEKLRSSFRRERERRELVNPQGEIGFKLHDVVIFDIETLPIKAYVWDTWNTNVLPSQMIEDWIILSWAAKDFMRCDVRSDILTSKEAKNRDDERIVNSLWNEFENARILIGHNITDFDIPKSNSRFLFHRLTPPAPYRTVDTLKILRYNFRFTFNKLDYANTLLGLTPKMDNDGFSLWARCAEGEEKALGDMELYNRQDVLSQEELYCAIRAWDRKHPNIGLFFENNDENCIHCGGKELILLGKPYYTQLGEYTALRCKNCGAINRRGVNQKIKEQRANLLRNV